MGGSLIASKGKVASGFTSVIVQSGFRAGADGFSVHVQSNIDLESGTILRSQRALDDRKNHFTTDGEPTLSDIQKISELQCRKQSAHIDDAGASLNGKLAPQASGAGFAVHGGQSSRVT
jgi:hypothetical protein